ncbi:FAD-dependent oxidoreductase [Polaromonas sp.]|jgi:glycine oxidase|uniref:FAD-dependent oxidoreductase n=1 Tax=Polaromonas sp. TaxID=1869339 RepID=UPI002BB6BA56|nr:FAD-dependent oxidoreductase [Polaromonas sp.]HQS30376.1 FAD-dependent oxidoreductase [Polaromonas sp.]HQS90364.1 FAD-dependent oxidoreductase [Polaromonas sp.]
MTDSRKSLHIGIAGAGLAGRTLAWRLLRAGCRVSLFDARRRDDLATASMTAAAMLSPLAELAVSDEAVFALGQRSMQLWPKWIAELAEGGLERISGPPPASSAPSGGSVLHEVKSVGAKSQPVYFRQEGTLVIAHTQDQASLEHFTRLLKHKLPEVCRAQVHTLDAQALALKEPLLAGRFSGGLFLEGEGQLANDQWMATLALEIDRLGGIWHEEREVQALERNRIVCADQSHPVDAAVDARGVGSKPLMPNLRGVRGEVLRVECRGVTLQRPVRLMHPRYQLYVAPRPNHEFVVGATELESEDAGPVTVRSVLELASALHSLHPAFGEARVLRMSAALRPALDDHRPVVIERDGVWHINGLYRHGYLCAPALVDDLSRTLLGMR